ncbi:MAG: histidine kinase [Arcanobacterium sp.]|nr:histidine kinase [Arcanobacterium sp.]
MNTDTNASSLFRSSVGGVKQAPSATYRGGFFDQIYAAWIGNTEPVWILGGLYAVYQILIGLRSEAAPVIVWLVAVLSCLAVLGRRKYWYLSVPLVLMAVSIAAYGGDIALVMLAIYLLAFSCVCLLETKKTLVVLLVLGAGVIGASFYENVTSGKTFLIPAITVFVFTCLSAALVRMRANSVVAKQKEQTILARLQGSESQARASEKATQMATTLHDSVGHSLTAIITLTEGLQADNELQPETQEIVELINEYARSGLRQTRTLVTAIAEGKQDKAENHTLEEVRELTQGINQLGICAKLEIAPGVPDSGEQIGLAYRIIREAITNTLKHATGATVVTVRLTAADADHLEVTVTDDGKQTNLHEHTPSSGYGLSKIRADLTSLGGHLTAGPNIDGGWKLQARIPKETTHD